ncbi:MAG: NAD(P)-dependent oxidoreductase [Saprospiraceae bacterium]|nr:NAD(P)-dependent oxidoreductase [Saprospiraceae bacterium]
MDVSPSFTSKGFRQMNMNENQSLRIGIIREGKTPPDTRVPLNPKQCAKIQAQFPIEIKVEQSPNRCFPDRDYEAAGLTLTDNISTQDILLGVKEVPIDQLISNKTYCFFSHTIKKQEYNRGLLQAVLQKNIRLIDWETLTNEKGKRVIAFGRFAGMVGAHNGIMTYGHRSGAFTLKRMKDCLDYAEAKSIYAQMKWPNMKIVLTGTGRVGQGAAQVLTDMGIRKVSPADFLEKDYDEAVFTQLNCSDYAARKDGKAFQKKDFYQNPTAYKSIFGPYTKVADVMINGIYWDNEAPAFFTKEEMTESDFHLQVIADVTCDIAPISSIPSTIKASTIAKPIFGFDPQTGEEAEPFQSHVVDMMTIDNLPNELPRDASTAFGKQFMEHVLPEFLKENSAMLDRATIAQNGQLGPHYQYLEDYVSGITL